MGFDEVFSAVVALLLFVLLVVVAAAADTEVAVETVFLLVKHLYVGFPLTGVDEEMSRLSEANLGVGVGDHVDDDAVLLMSVRPCRCHLDCHQTTFLSATAHAVEVTLLGVVGRRSVTCFVVAAAAVVVVVVVVVAFAAAAAAG